MKKRLIIFLSLFIFCLPPLIMAEGLYYSRGWNFSNDVNCISIFNFENGALTTDSINGNTLTASASSPVASATHKQGAYSADFESADTQLFYITDSNLSAGTPLKNGDTVKDFTILVSLHPESIPGSGSDYVFFSKASWGTISTVSVVLGAINEGGIVKPYFLRVYNDAGGSELVKHDSGLIFGSGDGWTVVAISYHHSTATYTIRMRDTSGNVIGVDKIGQFTNAEFNVSTGQMVIGALHTSGSTYTVPFDGLMDQFCIFRDVLSADEVTKIAKNLYPSNLYTHGPLTVGTNSRYFKDTNGNHVVLVGAHTWDNLQDQGASDPPPVFNFDSYLNYIRMYDHNFIRLWAWGLPRLNDFGVSFFNYTDVFPWNRTGPGNATDGHLKFDLTSFNSTYFTRLRNRIIAARKAGVYVSVMLFEGSLLTVGRQATDGFPLTAANNINSIDAGATTEALTLDDAAVTAVQDAYVQHVIDTVYDLDNVLYEIANESGDASVSWQNHMIALIRSYETSQSYPIHPIGMTSLYGTSDASLWSSDAEWISPDHTDTGGYDYITNPRPNAGSKVVLLDTDHLWGLGGTADWAWKAFTRGHNLLCMDSYGDGTTQQKADVHAVNIALGLIQNRAKKINFNAAVPSESFSETGYALTNPEQAYLVYQPGTGAFDIYMTGIAGDYAVEWLNLSTGEISAGADIAGGSTRTMTPPFSGAAVLSLNIK